MTYPHHLTDEEREAIPTRFIERPITKADIAAGRVGRMVVEIDDRPVRVDAYHLDDPLWWTDKAGRRWTFGRFADGSWFKEPWMGL